MLSAWLFSLHLAAACDFTLFAQPTPTNIWESLLLFDPQTSFVLCLSGSDPTQVFTLDDTSWGFFSQSFDLVIQ